VTSHLRRTSFTEMICFARFVQSRFWKQCLFVRRSQETGRAALKRLHGLYHVLQAPTSYAKPARGSGVQDV